MSTFVKQSAVSNDLPMYVNSAPIESSWGQPPASYYSFTIVNGIMQGKLISGVYQTTTSSQDIDEEENARPEVLQAIESTLQEGAAIWKELAKH